MPSSASSASWAHCTRTDVPVPTMLVLCEDESVIGRAFYVMEFMPGRVLWDQSLPALDKPARGAIYDEMNRVIAALHSVDVAGVGLAELRQAGQLLRAPDRPLDQAVPRVDHRTDRGDGPADRMAAGAHPGQRPRRHAGVGRARRLPPRQPDLRPDRAAHHRGARLGAVDDRPSARRLQLPLHVLAHPAGLVPRHRRPRPSRRSASRPRTSTCGAIANAPAAPTPTR